MYSKLLLLILTTAFSINSFGHILTYQERAKILKDSKLLLVMDNQTSRTSMLIIETFKNEWKFNKFEIINSSESAKYTNVPGYALMVFTKITGGVGTYIPPTYHYYIFRSEKSLKHIDNGEILVADVIDETDKNGDLESKNHYKIPLSIRALSFKLNNDLNNTVNKEAYEKTGYFFNEKWKDTY